MKRRRAARRVTNRIDHGPGMAAAREQVMHRSALCCEVRGPGCTELATDAHHRQTRRLGPDCPCNLLALCAHCHHENVHGQPATARDLGWIVSRHSFDGSGVAAQIHGTGLVFLNCDGTYGDRETDEEQALYATGITAAKGLIAGLNAQLRT